MKVVSFWICCVFDFSLVLFFCFVCLFLAGFLFSFVTTTTRNGIYILRNRSTDILNSSKFQPSTKDWCQCRGRDKHGETKCNLGQLLLKQQNRVVISPCRKTLKSSSAKRSCITHYCLFNVPFGSQIKDKLKAMKRTPLQLKREKKNLKTKIKGTYFSQVVTMYYNIIIMAFVSAVPSSPDMEHMRQKRQVVATTVATDFFVVVFVLSMRVWEVFREPKSLDRLFALHSIFGNDDATRRNTTQGQMREKREREREREEGNDKQHHVLPETRRDKNILVSICLSFLFVFFYVFFRHHHHSISRMENVYFFICFSIFISPDRRGHQCCVSDRNRRNNKKKNEI